MCRTAANPRVHPHPQADRATLLRGASWIDAMKPARCRTFFWLGSLGFRFTKISTGLAIIVALIAPAAAGPGTERVSVAAASNLVYALDALNATFRAQEPEVALTVATGASGSLVAQIMHGAPFDVFLSADVDYPRALMETGHADADSLTTFARGRLVAWTMRRDLAIESIGALASHPGVRKIAISNVDSAPYGRAARQALERSGVWRSIADRLVVGENVTQTAQFVETGGADVGFVALSLVLSPRLQNRGRWVAVEEDLYAPLDHAAVLTRRGRDNPAAARYLAFLRSAAAREVLERFGYALPEPAGAR